MEMEASLSTAARPAVALGQPDDLLTSAGLRAICGGISDMTLWRWTHQRDFPKPDVVINRRKFWRRSTVQAWIAEQVANASA
jgi:predicted DNA-binding transcriptional regulator AlpA